MMGYDPDACILCNRCVRYTQEVMMCSALVFEGRGAEARIVPTHGDSWLDTECELCGGCLSVCPTGAIYEKFTTGVAARPRAGAREDEDDVHVLRRRLPDRPQRRPQDEAHRQGDVGAGVPPQRGQPLRQGPLRFQLRPPPRPADRAARARRGRRAPPDRLGHGARDRGQRATQRDGAARDAGRRRARVGAG